MAGMLMQPVGITWGNTRFQKENRILILSKQAMLNCVTIWLVYSGPRDASPAVRMLWNVQ